jgi:ribosome-associated protein
MPSDEKAQIMLDAVEDRKAVDPVMLDLRNKTLMSDFFLICSGTSDTHVRAIAESVQEWAEMKRIPRPRVEGHSVAEWVLIDFGDVVVHVMGKEPRERYKLEQFWTTPQPKGALPPTPDTVGMYSLEDSHVRLTANWDLETDEDDDDEDAAFFEHADLPVEPLDDEDADLDAGAGESKPETGK